MGQGHSDIVPNDAEEGPRERSGLCTIDVGLGYLNKNEEEIPRKPRSESHIL